MSSNLPVVTKENHENISQDSWSLDRDMNSEPAEYEAQEQPLHSEVRWLCWQERFPFLSCRRRIRVGPQAGTRVYLPCSIKTVSL
jgi:hypothetical protein